MKGRAQITPKELAAPGMIAAVTATGFALLLSMIASPGGLSERIGDLSGRAETLQHAFATLKTPQSADAGLACFSSLDSAKYDLQAVVASAAGAQGVTVADFHADAVPTSSVAAVQPVVFHFTATGSYEGVTGILRRLAANRVEVFVDQADLVSNTTSVTLTFTGRIFCAS